MKRIFTASALILGVFMAQAQQVNSVLYWYKYYYVNPAFNDSSDHVLSFMARSDNGDQYQALLSYEMNLSKIRTHVGFISDTDNMGFLNLNTFGFTANHGFNIGNSSKFTIGTKIYNKRLSVDPGAYDDISTGDPLLNPENSHSKWFGDFGIHFAHKDFFTGISAINVTNNYLLFDYRRFNIVSGYGFAFGKYLKTQHSLYIPFSSEKLDYVDFNNVVILKDKFYLGLTLRSYNNNRNIYNDTVMISSGIEFSKRYKFVFLVYANGKHFSDDFRGEMLVVFKL